MTNYQVKLTPVETFFFGGEKHSLNEQGNWVADYFSESNFYPQQSTLLGLVRYLLLLKNESIFSNNRISDHAKASAFIGESSFDYLSTDNSFGKIETISPLYFTYYDERFFFAPFDYGCKLSDDLLIEKETKEGLEQFTAKQQSQFIKQNLVSNLGNLNAIEDVVKSSAMVGNEKGENGTSKEDAFYKQNMKYLAPGWSFAIDIDIEDDAGVRDKDVLFIPFGGEKCFFKLEINKNQKQEIKILPEYKRKPFTIICISDCFLAETTLLNLCDFAITDFVSFRNLHSKVSVTRKYSGLSKTDPMQQKQSNRHNLLKRGSVLYFNSEKDFDKVKGAIDSNKGLTKVGFNHILTINK